MIDHVTANVGDFEQAKSFYEQALAPLGYSVQMEFEGAAGFGTGEGIPDFWIGSSPERGATHVALQREGPRGRGRVLRGGARRGRQGQRRSRASARTTTRRTTRPTSTTPTATTSRR